MNSTDVVMGKDIYKDGTSPIYLRLIINRKAKYKTIAKVNSKNWDGSKVVNLKSALSINSRISQELLKARQYLNKCAELNITPSASDFFQRNHSVFLVDQIQELADRYEKEGKFGSMKRTKATKSKIESFDPKASIHLSEEWGEKFIRWQRTVLGNVDSTIQRDVKIIRQIIKSCVKSGLTNYNYIADVKISANKSVVVYLDRSEIEAIEDIKLSKFLDKYRKVFLFMIYNRGIRVADAITLKKKNVIGTRLQYVSRKSGKNFNIELSDKSIKIIDSLHHTYEWLFPVLERKDLKISPRDLMTRIGGRTTKFNENIKSIATKCKINKRVTTHVARHTFAYHFLKSGGSIIDLSHLLGHGSVNTTETYARKLLEVDDLDDQVRGLF